MKLHPREKKVRDAKMKLMEVLMEIRKELTPWEYINVITSELAGEWLTTAKYGIREERHPEDPDKAGGVE